MTISSDRQSGNFESVLSAIPLAQKAPALLIMLVALIAVLPGFFNIPPVDRDEPRFAQASRQMAQTGDFVDIRFQERTRYKKPIGIYWLQAGSALISGFVDPPIWVYRIPSAVATILSALLVWRIALLMAGPAIGLFAALLFPLLILSSVEARLAKTDMMLLATILAAMLPLARAWLGKPEKRDSLLFWLAIACGILIKGPLGGMVIGLTIAALSLGSRRISWLKPLISWTSILLAIAITIPWFLAIGIKTEGDFYLKSLGADLFAKVASAKEKHGAPPGIYFLIMFATLWPVAAFFTGAMRQVKTHFRDPVILFLLAWIIPTWLVFEFVSTKLPHYVFPVYPALLLLILLLLSKSADDAPPSRTWVAWLEKINRLTLILIPFVLCAATIAGPVYLKSDISWLGAGLTALALGLGVRAYSERDVAKSLGSAGLAALLIFVGLFQFSFPGLKPLWIAPRLATAIDAAISCEKGTAYMMGYNEPSLVFLSNHSIQLLTPEYRKAKGEGACDLFVIDKRYEPAFQKLRDDGLQVETITQETGINLNGGRDLTLTLYAPAKPGKSDQ